MSQRTPSILIVGPDSRLEEEVAQALAAMTDTRAVLHYTHETRQAVEIARSRHPDFVLVEMSSDLRALKNFAEEVAKGSPEARLAAVFAPDLFGHAVSESAVLIEALRAGVQDFLRRPVSRLDLGQLLDRLYRRESAPTALRAGKLISFISNKGGVGKSTLAVNVGCGLAQRYPDQVLLIDTSLQVGGCAALLDLRPTTSLTDTVRERDRLDEVLLRQLAVPHPSGLHLLAAPAGPVEAAEIDDNLMARVLNLARRAYSFVIVDSFPLIDRVMMAVLDLSDRAYVVVESVVPTVLAAARLLKLLETLGVPADRLRVVLNRYTGSTDNLKPADVALRLGQPLNHVLPYQKKVVVAGNIGRPYILGTSRLWGLGRVLHQLVGDVEATPHAVRAAPAVSPASRAGPSEAGPARLAGPTGNGTPSHESTDHERSAS